jgi:hypothetical protein
MLPQPLLQGNITEGLKLQAQTLGELADLDGAILFELPQEPNQYSKRRQDAHTK